MKQHPDQHSDQHPDPHRVIIIGAGYAGLMAANRLGSRTANPAVRVTLINPVDVFVERIRLHEFAAGSRENPTHSLASLTPTSVELVVDSVAEIRTECGEVVTSMGDIFAYDSLIYAPGSGAASTPAGTSSVHTHEAAAQLRDRLENLSHGARVAIVGGGLTGIETAAECAQRFPQLTVTLCTSGELAPSVGPGARTRLRATLTKLGVELRERTSIDPTADLAAELNADEIVWSVGFGYPELAKNSGLPVDAHNRLRVTDTLHVDGLDNIFGAGDAAIISTSGYEFHRPSCASALPMGAHAADNILAALDGRPRKVFSLGYVMQSISVGRKVAIIQPVDPHDAPKRMHLRGAIGAFTKETICRMTVRWLRNEGRKHRSYSWPRGKTHNAGAIGRVSNNSHGSSSSHSAISRNVMQPHD